MSSERAAARDVVNGYVPKKLVCNSVTKEVVMAARGLIQISFHASRRQKENIYIFLLGGVINFSNIYSLELHHVLMRRKAV